MSFQYNEYTQTRSEIPETQVYKFIEIHTKDAAKIKVNESKEFAFNVMKGWMNKGKKLFNINKPEDDDIEISYDDCIFKSFWLVDAHREIKYQCDDFRSVNVENIDAKHILIQLDNQTQSLPYEVHNSEVKIKITEICSRKNDYYNILDNETGFIDNNFQKDYIDNKDYRKRKFNIDVDRIIKPALSKTAVVQKINESLSAQINATRINFEHISYNRIDLYLIPIYIFKCYKKSTKETAYIKFNALTGKIIKDQNKLGEILSQEEFRNVVLDVASEVASSFVPGSGVILKHMVKPKES